MRRSFWRLPKAAMTAVDDDGNEGPAFAGVVAYHETTQYVYAMADRWDRPDLRDAGGQRQDLSKSTDFNRYVRQLVRHKGRDRVVERVRTSQVLDDDVMLEADQPAVLFAGDDLEDVIGGRALRAAAAAIAAEV